MANINITNSLYEDIVAFCKANDISDIDNFIEQMLIKGFDMKKYGESFAFIFNKKESDIVHLKNNVEEIKPEPTPEPVAEVLEPKKRGKKKKVEEPKVEVQPEPVIEKEPEPVYVIKQEEQPVKKPVTLYRKDDNYDVYDI